MKNSIDALSKGYSTAELQDKLGKVQDLIGNSANVDPSKLVRYNDSSIEGIRNLSTKVDMKVLGGIIVGVIAGFLYNKFHKIKLPEWLGFFAGKRFVPIVTSVVMLILGILFAQIWPAIQNGIDDMAYGIVNLGAVGSGLFGLLNRLLIPIGLHHVMNTYFSGSYLVTLQMQQVML